MFCWSEAAVQRVSKHTAPYLGPGYTLVQFYDAAAACVLDIQHIIRLSIHFAPSDDAVSRNGLTHHRT